MPRVCQRKPEDEDASSSDGAKKPKTVDTEPGSITETAASEAVVNGCSDDAAVNGTDAADKEPAAAAVNGSEEKMEVATEAEIKVSSIFIIVTLLPSVL